VLDFGFDFKDAGGGNGGFGGDGLGGGGGNDAIFGQNSAGRRFHLEPAAEFVLVRPDGAHGGARVAIDQGKLLATSF
jgi:hypothetical protein